MNYHEKITKCREQHNSLLCVGLDPDINKLPEHLKNEKYPIFEFNRVIIDATYNLVCAYKPQVAYYAGQNAELELRMSIEYLQDKYPDVPVILDAKRGDIGSTAAMYAKEAFEIYNADAVTVNPYMGIDTLKPFLDNAGKGVVILCRTSNPSGKELQDFSSNGKPLYLHVAELANSEWNYNNNVVLVVGATYPEELGRIRETCPDLPFLVPGIGVQGGDIEKVLQNGLRQDKAGLIINSSRGIIYADSSENFGEGVRQAALDLRDQINSYR